MASAQPRAATMVAGPAEMAPIQRVEPMKRPGFGRAGRRIVVDTNFFELRANNLRWVSQYSVAIEALRDDAPPGARRRGRPSADNDADKKWVDIAPSSFIGFNRAVFAQWCKTSLPRNLQFSLAYDGRKLAYAPAEIPSNLEDRPGDKEIFFEIEVDKDGPVADRKDAGDRREKVRVKIMKAAAIDVARILGDKSPNVLEAGPALASIDAVLACGPLKQHVQVGRSFYHPEGSHDLGEGAEAWRGFYQSARLSIKGLVVNMDESRTPFWGGGGEALTTLMNKMGVRIRPNDPMGSKRAGKLLYGVKIKASHSNIMYRVHGFDSRGPDAVQFFDETAQQKVTITQYFQQKYGITLRDRTSPCVITNPKKKTLVPIEVLFVSRRQRLTKAMTPRQTSAMIRCAATKPHVRLAGALSAVRRANHNADPTCKAFGMSIEGRNMSVEARVLPAPVIFYKGRQEKPKLGVWDSRHNNGLFNPAPLFTWAVLNLTRARDDEIKRFVQNLTTKAKRMGMNATTNPPLYHGRDNQIEQKLRQIHRDSQNADFRVNSFPLQLVLVISFKQDTQIYNTVKLMGDIELGVATQVMLSKHLGQNEVYMGNLLLKINMKLGGANCVPQKCPAASNVPFFKRNTIILGADVTHPTGGGMRPSVAALVCSRDSNFSQFTGAIRNQPPKQELMTEMYGMFREVYDRWRAKNGNGHCEAIVMFRDGVSEGQFQQVLDEELMAIRRACHDYDRNFNPYITYIVVTKRHHARFFPKTRDNADRSGNVLPGTVIDTGVVSSQYYDFYLNSHAGIQGTSRPSKYTILIDENKIPVDALQDYIFRLTHNYARCNRSVSIVNSAYYAHLLAFRGRAYLNDDDTETVSSFSDSNVPATVQLHQRLGQKLFFV